MGAATFIWNKVRLLNKVPGAHAAYRAFMRLMLRDGKTVIIRRGPLAGSKWRHRQVFQPWMAMGLYEPQVAGLLNEVLKPGDVFYDIGANAGYYTLLGARVAPSGRVYAFDPHPLNAATAAEQLALNSLSDLGEVVQVAIAAEEGTLEFCQSSTNANSHLVDFAAPHLSNEGPTISVRAVSLDEFVKRNEWPSVIKMDIEGGEVEALSGAATVLTAANRPVLLISTHSDELDRQCKEIIARHDYEFVNLDGFEQMIYARPRRSSAA